MTRRKEILVFAKNAAANVGRGGASAIVALLLPPFLTRSLSRDAFGAWSLVLQLSAYVGYFDFGIQTAVARFVAHSTERGDLEYRDRIVSTAFALLAISGCVAFIGILALVIFMPEMFHQINGSLMDSVRLAVLLVGGSLALSLPSSTFAAIFVGLQRNEIPAASISLPRLVGAALVVVVVRLGGGLPSMALVTAAANISTLALQYFAYRRWIPAVRISLSKFSRRAVREMIDYCSSLTVWGVGLLLVTGLDLTIVGAYRFKEVGYYSVAATLVTFSNGLFGAIFAAMGSPAAVLHARGDGIGLGRMVSATTRIGMVLLLATGLPLIFGAREILRLWVGSAYAEHATPLLQLLVLANIIRTCITPYIIAMISTGEQRRIIFVPLVEGIVNLVSSLIAGYYWGAIGVAFGTLIGSFVSIGGHVLYTMRRSVAIELRVRNYFRDSLLRPTVCALPFLLVGTLWSLVGKWLPLWFSISTVAVGIIVSGYLFWKVGLVSNERRELIARVGFR
jgi:O-antigen/teichoic acid export membrane protein